MQIISGTEIETRCLLFDMDGTLIDSTPAVERVWRQWAEQHGIPFESFRHAMHGRRAIDTLREIIPPHLDLMRELDAIDSRELIETDGIVAIPGAAKLLASLPRAAWALVTSAEFPLARVRMAAAGLPIPETIVSANDIRQGKPDPECYRLALEKLGRIAQDALVFEDAPAGLAAGHAAGCRTIALATREHPKRLDAEAWLPDFSAIEVARIEHDGLIRLRVV
jgi:sugar-phosphatase